LGKSVTKGKRTFGGRTGRSPKVATRLERERERGGGEERKKGDEDERAG
jgi:hypothetical protein